MSSTFLFTLMCRTRNGWSIALVLALFLVFLVGMSHAQGKESNAPAVAFSSGAPSVQSNAPSPAVTRIKSNAPSFLKVAQPSTIPTSFPFTIVDDTSDFPSLVPTRGSAAPTLTPGPSLKRTSDSPSDVPSDMPSIILTTVQPTIVATPSPSLGNVTTASPVSGGIPISVRFFGMAMILKGVGELSYEATQIWVNVTTDFYETVHNIGVVGSNAATTASSQRRQWRRQRQRYLQTQGIEDFTTVITYTAQRATEEDKSNNNSLFYFQEVSYSKTSDSAPSGAELIQDPFKDETLNRLYVDTLRASNAAFSGLEYNVPVPTIPIPAPSTDRAGSDNDKSPSTVVIAGIVIGGVFFLALVFMAYQYISSNKNRRELTSGYGAGDHDNSGGRPPGGDESSSSRIPNDDFHDDDRNKKKRPDHPPRQPSPNESMLFDGNEEDSEQDCSNVGDDVGGAGQHQQHAGRTREEDRNAASLRPKLGENEELLVIQAPAGWLGVVIDTPEEDGLPTVHDVKESSAIFGILQIGDRLIAVDEEDVTHLTATQVSKVISSKAANSVRLLRVIRSKDLDIEIV